MTGWLASVANSTEIARVLPAAPDILDLKDPAAGALGAWPVEDIAATVRELAAMPGRPRLSATVGDRPMTPDAVLPATRRIAATGVDFVKIGIAPEGDPDRCIDALAPLAAEGARLGTRLIAVFFADLWPTDPDCLPVDRIAAAGFAGAMLDTAGKRHGLRHHWPDTQLAAFVTYMRSLNLLTGLAGSLRVVDIPALLALSPDYLGFRGALCGGERTADIDPRAVSRVAAGMAGHPPDTQWQPSRSVGRRTVPP